jgi:hypothetical protein
MKQSVHEKYSEALEIQSHTISHDLRSTQAELSFVKQKLEQLQVAHSHSKKVISRAVSSRAVVIQRLVTAQDDFGF